MKSPPKREVHLRAPSPPKNTSLLRHHGRGSTSPPRPPGSWRQVKTARDSPTRSHKHYFVAKAHRKIKASLNFKIPLLFNSLLTAPHHSPPPSTVRPWDSWLHLVKPQKSPKQQRGTLTCNCLDRFCTEAAAVTTDELNRKIQKSQASAPMEILPLREIQGSCGFFTVDQTRIIPS